MKTFYIFLSGIFITLNLYSQNPPNPNFIGIFETECPFDSTITINRTSAWLIYQTLNDKWDGVIDSSLCISVEEIDNDLEIDLNQIDPTKPLFIKSLMNDDTKVLLEQNSLFNTVFYTRKSETATLDLNEDCENDLCSGLIIGVEIPDSTYTEKALRIYKTSASQGASKVRAEMCIATEKFDENYLKEFVLKFTFTNEDLAGEWLRLRYVYNEAMDSWGSFKIYNLPISEDMNNGSSYDVNLEDLSNDYISNSLLMYTDTTYPSPAHISYVEANLLVNTPMQETINFLIYNYQTLIYQPFTELRGGLIEGSDSLRHIVNLINNGGSICMYGIIDFAFDGTTNYVHKGGNIEFHGKTSCMIFKNGGNLSVAENTTFYYGNGGEGMLAISDGSTINIEKGGALVIDNQMVLKGNVNLENPQVYMELNSGSALRFAENAKLSHVGINPEMRLNVYMKGGVLDDHLLNEAERQLINKIYPEHDILNNFKLSPNPVSEYCKLSMIVEKESELHLKVIDMNGRVVQYLDESLVRGYNEFEIELNNLSSGMYFIEVESGDINSSQKFIKL